MALGLLLQASDEPQVSVATTIAFPKGVETIQGDCWGIVVVVAYL